MSETVLRLRLEELAVLRLTCLNPLCKAVTEVSLDRLPRDFEGTCCPVCKEYFAAPGRSRANHVKELADALVRLAGLDKEKVTVEFVVPAPKDGE